MGISPEQYKVRSGYFNNGIVCKQSPKVHFSKNQIILYMDKTTKQIKNDMTKQQDYLGPCHLLLVYVYILLTSLIFLMHIDVTKKYMTTLDTTESILYSSLIRDSPFLEEISLPYLRQLINWAVITIIFLIKIPSKDICIYNSMQRSSNLNRMNFINFWYQIIFRNGKTCLYYITSINLILIVLATPSIVNPGPNPKARPLTIFYNNVQGLIDIRDLKSKEPQLNMTKLYELHGHIFTTKPDVIILNETWLKKSILDTQVLPQNYKIRRVDRTGKTHPWDPSNPRKFRENGGGVLIAHRTDIDVESTEVGVIKVQAEILTINLKLPSGKRLSLSTFYRVGNLGTENYESVRKYLTTLASKKKLDKHVLIGDLNFPEIRWPDNVTTVDLHKNFLELLMVDLCHSQIITESTHKNGKILDLLFTNIPEIIENVSVLGYKEACSSDHYGINFKIKLDVPMKKTVKRKVYNYPKADWRALNFDIRRIDWESHIGMHDPHESWPLFRTAMEKLCDKHIPKKTIINEFQAPWFDTDCEKILREKEKWRAKANSERGTEEDHQKFRKLRKDFKKIMNEKMRLNVEDESDTSLISKKFWKYVKSKTNSTRIPETVWYKNKFRSKPIDQANLFNEFFSDQFSLESKYNIEIDMDSNDRFSDVKFHELDVLLLLKDINPSKTAGPDGIHGMVLKKCASTLAKPLTIMFNISFVTGIIPNEWKLASVVPVHKKDEKGSVENYRPISLTSLIMKVFERCIRKELLNYCEHLIDPRQHGFTNAKSCSTQMVPFTYDLTLTLNNKSKVDVIYFDFAKAFDSVSHDLILKKLKHEYKVDGLMLRFIKSYLQGRQQQVVIGGVASSQLKVKSGVPQGSILGPLLFVLFINDMFQCISQKTDIALYADDTKIWREIIISEDHFILQSDIDKLFAWSIRNKMKFHPSKSKVLSITNQRNMLHNLPFTIFQYRLDSTYIDYVSSYVDLGVTVNNKLLWKEQCDKLVCKGNSQLGMLMRTCHFTMNKKQKRTFYLTIVRSIFEHCSIIWRPKSTNQIASFDAIQKKAIKWINGRRFDHYSDLEYFNKQKELNILPMKFKFVLNDLIMYYKIINLLIHIKLPEHFTFVEAEQVRYTRQTAAIINNVDKTLIKCNIRPTGGRFRDCFFYRTMDLWNRLPSHIRQVTNVSIFKVKLTTFLWGADIDWPD